MDPSEWVQVVTTCNQVEPLQEIAKQLVEQAWAGCVQVGGPVRSFYQWQGKLEQAEEWHCTIKTRATLVSQVQETIQRLHPYEEPELIVTPIVGGSESYLQWLAEQTSPDR